MSATREYNKIREELMSDPEAREEIAAYMRAMEDATALYELRRQLNMTQTELAGEMNTSQANISRIERGSDLYLSTLREYVEAMGGRLEINAVFPEGTIPIPSTVEDDRAAGEDQQVQRDVLPEGDSLEATPDIVRLRIGEADGAQAQDAHS